MQALRHFAVTELNHPELMDTDFLSFLDAVRGRAGVPFVLTSDARTHEENAIVGGSARSLHLLGRAVDFVPRPWDREALWKIVAAVVEEAKLQACGVELEIVQSDADSHLHLGLFVDERSSRLVLAID